MTDRETGTPGAGGEKKWKLLVVDDNETICALLSAVLNSKTCMVAFTQNGGRALAMLQEEPHDLCFLDLRMPGENILDLMARIRTLAPATRIVVMTGSDPDEATLRTIREHAVLLLIKPFDLFLLGGIVRELMDKNIRTFQEYANVVARLTGEKRRHDRKPFTASDPYSVHQSGEQGFDTRLNADTIDISQSGLGIRTNIALEPGRIVRLRKNSETVCGIVRWSAADGRRELFRAGIQFMQCDD